MKKKQYLEQKSKTQSARRRGWLWRINEGDKNSYQSTGAKFVFKNLSKGLTFLWQM